MLNLLLPIPISYTQYKRKRNHLILRRIDIDITSHPVRASQFELTKINPIYIEKKMIFFQFRISHLAIFLYPTHATEEDEHTHKDIYDSISIFIHIPYMAFI